MEQIAVVKLKAVEATAENLKEFGQVIEASPDTKEFGPHDAQLDLSQGIPRLYIMNLQNQPRKFSRITHHSKVTQCLGSIGGDVWYLGVAKRSLVDPIVEDKSQNVEQSPMGHFFVPPGVDGVQVFKITGPKFLKLERGTWHAGPLFKSRTMNFFNLELNNTNEVDITTHNFKKDNATTFVIEEYLICYYANGIVISKAASNHAQTEISCAQLLCCE